jgi:predicted metal-binding membrane protein
MRYQCRVTNFAHEQTLTHLCPADARLSAALARPKLVAFGCIVVLTALGWLSLGLMSTEFEWGALCRPAASSGAIFLLAPMWAAMTLAMMLPTAGPMILTYAEIADTAASKREAVVSPLVLTAGYVTVWFGFASLAAVLQSMLARAGFLNDGQLGLQASGAFFLTAGLYQFSALKHACLRLCQRPFSFFFLNWTTQPSGVFRLGLRQGLYCLGCCWAMMLLMFALGTMNVVWMAALGVVMTIEKMATTAHFSRTLGIGFAAIGCGMVTVSLV